MIVELLDRHDDRMPPEVLLSAWKLTYEFEFGEIWSITEDGVVELYLMSEDWDAWKELWKRDDDGTAEGRWVGLDSNRYVRMSHLGHVGDVRALARVLEELNPPINISVVSPGDMRCHTDERYQARIWFDSKEALFEFNKTTGLPA